MCKCNKTLPELSLSEFQCRVRIVERLMPETPHIYIYLCRCRVCGEHFSVETPPTDTGCGLRVDLWDGLKHSPAAASGTVPHSHLAA